MILCKSKLLFLPVGVAGLYITFAILITLLFIYTPQYYLLTPHRGLNRREQERKMMKKTIKIIKEINEANDELRIEYSNYAGDEKIKGLIEGLINRTLLEAEAIMYGLQQIERA